jgi:hypothetical protein
VTLIVRDKYSKYYELAIGEVLTLPQRRPGISFSDKRMTSPLVGDRMGPGPGRNALSSLAMVSWRGRAGPRVAEAPSGFRLSRLGTATHADHPRDRAREAEDPHVRPHPVHLPAVVDRGGHGGASDVACDKPDPSAPGIRRPFSNSPYKRAFAAPRPGDEARVFGPIGDLVLHERGPAILQSSRTLERRDHERRVRASRRRLETRSRRSYVRGAADAQWLPQWLPEPAHTGRGCRLSAKRL